MHDPDTIALVRRHVDGELTPDEDAAFTPRLAADADLRAAVEQERELRARVAAVLQSPATSPPEDLAERVRAALATEPAPGESDARPAAHPGRERIAPESPPVAAATRHPRRGRSDRRPRVNIFMVVATLALVAAAVLIGIYGPNIDHVRPADDLVSEAAVWASTEHGRCTTDTSVQDTKLVWHDPEEARRALAAHLDVSDVIVPLALRSIGYEFRGAGDCMLPAGGLPSGHMMFRRAADHPRGPAMISIFVVPDVGQYRGRLRLGMIPGQWYDTDGGPKCSRTIRRITDGEVVYFLVCCDEGDLDLAQRTIGVHLKGVR